MSIRITYQQTCDGCGEDMESEVFTLRPGDAIPNPRPMFKFGHRELCRKCALLVSSAANNALDELFGRS
jgi:hypothetical protein